jgi:hypothetical protein
VPKRRTRFAGCLPTSALNRSSSPLRVIVLDFAQSLRLNDRNLIIMAGMRTLPILLTLSGIPGSAFAQAAIAGVVADSSGAVLPGVTIEAASPVLIEKSRTVFSDGSGRYRVEDLRPGLYTVTFTLQGFSTVKREEIELTGSFTATINASLPLGRSRKR